MYLKDHINCHWHTFPPFDRCGICYSNDIIEYKNKERKEAFKCLDCGSISLKIIKEEIIFPKIDIDAIETKIKELEK